MEEIFGIRELLLRTGECLEPGDWRTLSRCERLDTDYRLFPISQDQRNTVRGRLRYQIMPRLWIAGGVQFDSGLPFQFQCNPSLTLEECTSGEVHTYGQQVIDRVNFVSGRIYPTFQLSRSVGVDVYKAEGMNVRFQIDGQNLTNVVDVIDFGGASFPGTPSVRRGAS